MEPQVDYLKIDGSVKVDIIMRFETISDDFSAACKRLGLPSLKLPRRNKGIERATYHEYLDKPMQRMIGARYREDVTTFGYQF